MKRVKKDAFADMYRCVQKRRRKRYFELGCNKDFCKSKYAKKVVHSQLLLEKRSEIFSRKKVKVEVKALCKKIEVLKKERTVFQFNWVL